MQRFRYAWITAGDVHTANQLLTQGWRPVREVVADRQDAADEMSQASGHLLLVLERDDEVPAHRGETIADGVRLEALSDVALLDGLTGEELREFVAACDAKQYAADDTVFDAGQELQRLYVILEGTASIHLHGLPIDDPVVLEAGPFDCFGESTFFAPAPHATYAIADSALRTLELPRSAYDELLQAQRTAAFKIANNAAVILGQRLQATDEWVREILQQGTTAEIIRSWRQFRRGFSPRESGRGFVHI